jgi:aspartate racemase
MKKLGLIGGTGPESTVPYYKEIVFGVQKRVGKPYFPPLVIESLSVFEVLRYCDEGDYDGLTDYLCAGFEHLAAAGADFAALTGNTPHIVFDRLAARSPIPLVSSVETAYGEAHRLGMKKVGLLGTNPTMRGTFFKEPFLRGGIDVAIPADAEMDYIAEKISAELEMGVVREETRKKIFAIARRMQREDGIEALVLGCTELPMLLADGTKPPLPCLDTMAIHIQALIEEILK